MCPTDEILRAKLDGELSQTEAQEVETHLSACAGCRERTDSLTHQAQEVRGMFSSLSPFPSMATIDSGMTDTGIALARFKARHLAAEAPRASLFTWLSPARLRPAWGVFVVASLIVVLVSFAPARTLAQKVLAMLRVQKIAVVPVDLPHSPGEQNGGAGKLVSQMISDNIVVTMHGQPHTVASAAEASERAGYKVRLLGGRADAPQLTVQSEQAFHMALERERLQAVLDELGRSDLILPASIDGATVAVHVSPMVMAKYGNCPRDANKVNEGAPAAEHLSPPNGAGSPDCVVLVQVPSPTVSVPPDLNIAPLAEAGLQIAGMSASQAHAFSQTVDWTSTLVVPIPRSISSYQTVAVDGVDGTLIELPAFGEHRPAGYMLVWVKNTVIYSLTGIGNSTDAVPLAESLN